MLRMVNIGAEEITEDDDIELDIVVFEILDRLLRLNRVASVLRPVEVDAGGGVENED